MSSSAQSIGVLYDVYFVVSAGRSGNSESERDADASV